MNEIEINRIESLTKAEHAMLMASVSGYSQKEYAFRCNLSHHTPKQYVKNILIKMHARNYAQACILYTLYLTNVIGIDVLSKLELRR